MIEKLPVKISIRLQLEPHSALPEPCWIWIGRRNRNGYGRVCWNGTEPVAHRLVYELLVASLPRSLVLDHLCRQRACCNPGHLVPVTVRENTLRGNAVLFRRVERAST